MPQMVARHVLLKLALARLAPLAHAHVEDARVADEHVQRARLRRGRGGVFATASALLKPFAKAPDARQGRQVQQAHLERGWVETLGLVLGAQLGLELGAALGAAAREDDCFWFWFLGGFLWLCVS